MKRTFLHSSGFSIVEVLVSAAILAVAVIATVTIVRKGGDLQTTDGCRRQARAVLNARFETVYHQNRYALIQPTTTVAVPETIGTLTGGGLLTGTLYTTIDAETLTVSTTTPTLVPTKKVALKLEWNDFEGGTDSISMTKWISE